MDTAECLTLKGNLHERIETTLVKRVPQVHTHMLTDEDEFKMIGFYRVELCCHGCGSSKLIFSDVRNDDRIHSEQDKFLEAHEKCPDLGFENWCPDIRLKTEISDLRKKKKESVLTPSSGSSKPTRAQNREP